MSFSIVYQLQECVQLYRATWDEPQPTPVPRWRLLLAAQYKDTKDPSSNKDVTELWKYQPAPVLQPKRETLVVSVGDSQWQGFLQETKEVLLSTYEKSNKQVKQIGIATLQNVQYEIMYTMQ